MTKAERIFKCHKCERRNGSFCGIDKAIISEHASERYCPLGKYKLGMGDVIAIITHRTGIQWLLRKIRRKPTCGGCKARQIKLNEVSNG